MAGFPSQRRPCESDAQEWLRVTSGAAEVKQPRGPPGLAHQACQSPRSALSTAPRSVSRPSWPATAVVNVVMPSCARQIRNRTVVAITFCWISRLDCPGSDIELQVSTDSGHLHTCQNSTPPSHPSSSADVPLTSEAITSRHLPRSHYTSSSPLSSLRSPLTSSSPVFISPQRSEPPSITTELSS